MRSGQRGFSLLELLVAMAVLALLSLLSFRGLGSILDAEARLQEDSQRWNNVSLLASQLGQDVAAAIERTVRDEADQLRPALSLRSDAGTPVEQIEAQLAITRLGHGDASSTQGAVRRVGYRLREGTVEYLVWPAADAAPGHAPLAEPVLEGVSSLQFLALDFDGTWTPAWPAGKPAGTLPRAIAMQLGLAGGEQITRIFPLR